MIIVLIISLLYLVFAICINLNWIQDIACYFGYPIAIYLVTFVALIPGFIYVFTLLSILLEKNKRKTCTKQECDVTVLVPIYNAKKTIKKTIESITCQKYHGNIHIIAIDDGSADESLELLKKINCDNQITILETKHRGKSYALNEGLKHVQTDYVITVDSDTTLHPLAIKNIMDKLVNSDKNIVATAGAIFVKNDQTSFVTKLQQWDYTLGIFGVKLYQGSYHSTLVAQGAFSAYKTEKIKEIGGWRPCVGEDIVLTWNLLSKGYQTNFAKNAVAFTETPDTFKGLFRQRQRWARGMIEAFKQTKIITSKKLNLKSKFLMCMNIFFPFVDFALLIFIPLGLIFLLFHNNLFIGLLTLLVILLGMILCLVIEIKRQNVFREIDCKLEKRSILAFIFYALFYAFILAPFCLTGYIKELVNTKKEW